MGCPPLPAVHMRQFPLWTLPYRDAVMPFGDHLMVATREKILKGEFVGIFTLFFRKVDKKDEDKDKDS